MYSVCDVCDSSLHVQQLLYMQRWRIQHQAQSGQRACCWMYQYCCMYCRAVDACLEWGKRTYTCLKSMLCIILLCLSFTMRLLVTEVWHFRFLWSPTASSIYLGYTAVVCIILICTYDITIIYYCLSTVLLLRSSYLCLVQKINETGPVSGVGCTPQRRCEPLHLAVHVVQAMQGRRNKPKPNYYDSN